LFSSEKEEKHSSARSTPPEKQSSLLSPSPQNKTALKGGLSLFCGDGRS